MIIGATPGNVTMKDSAAEDGDEVSYEALANLPYVSTLAAAIESTENGREECTLYPTTASDAELVTQWITARDGAFVQLTESR